MHLLTAFLVSLFLFPPPALPSIDTLGVRNAHAMAYDTKSKMVLLFGGADEKQVLGDLWAWDGREWTCLSEDGPPSRTFPGMTYDSHHELLVVFGGNRVLFDSEENRNIFLNDMWVWDGRHWKEIKGKMPSPRAEASMAFDANRNRVILFGGYRTENGERIRLGDTWEWDGLEWELKSNSGPAPRNGTVMSFDPYRNRTILFWGSNEEGTTWEWNGIEWEKIIPADTEGRFNPAMAFDQKHKKLIRFGGWFMGERQHGTWSYDGTTWMKLPVEGPGKRNHSFMTYDTKRQVIVLFGGHDGDQVYGDTWEWDGEKWELRSDSEEKTRIYNGH